MPLVQGSVYMVQELMHTDLWTALADDRLQSTLHWYNRLVACKLGAVAVCSLAAGLALSP